MAGIVLTRNEGLDILSVLDDATDHLVGTRVYALVIALQDAARILIDKLFPDLPRDPE